MSATRRHGVHTLNAYGDDVRNCITLHPPEEFPELGEVAGEDGGSCGLGLSKEYIDLCPCKRFKCHDLERVFRKLEQTISTNPRINT